MISFKTPTRATGVLYALTAACAAFWMAPQAVAQTTPAQQAQAAVSAQKSPVWIKDPKRVMPMRQMTNLERRKAATRNASRRNADARAHRAAGNQGATK